MGSFNLSPIVWVFLVFIFTVAALTWSMRQGDGAPRPRGLFFLAALPGLLAILTFSSLAIHMHFSLGGWPDFYGTEGVSQALITHAELAYMMFTIAILAGFSMPLVAALFALVPRLRSSAVYPSFCGVVCWLCLFMTALAPAGFQRWWWD